MGTLIFGGSFDPLHNGHLAIAKYCLNHLSLEEVVFLPARAPRWKELETTPFERLEMLKLALEDFKEATIDLTEFNSKDEVNYTYKTILSLKDKYPGPLYLLIGTDQLEQLDKWYEIDKLAHLVTFVAIVRPNYDVNFENIQKYGVTLIQKEISPMSSTAAREMKSLDLPKRVIDYIISHNLYFTKTLHKYIGEKRFNHSERVASLAYEIALANGLDPHTAFLAGLVHDIAKELPMEKQLNYMKKHHQDLVDSIAPQLYHQFVGVGLIRKLGIHNREIEEAIMYHATGRAHMSLLGRLIYASDKIDPGRGYDSSDMIKSCLNDLEKGFIYVLKENIIYFQKKNIDYQNPLTIECINYYLKGEEEYDSK